MLYLIPQISACSVASVAEWYLLIPLAQCELQQHSLPLYGHDGTKPGDPALSHTRCLLKPPWRHFVTHLAPILGDFSTRKGNLFFK